MKIKNLLIACVVLMTVLVMVSCGGKPKDTPKSLAKETFDLTAQLVSNPEQAVEITAKLNIVREKVSKFSPAKQLSYTTELAKLSVNAVKDVIQSPDVQETFKEVSDAINSSEVQDALRSVGSDVQDALKDAGVEVQDALESASNAIRSLRIPGL